MQKLLDHLLSKKLKSATALILQSLDGKQLISTRLEENSEAYKEVAHHVIRDQRKLITFDAVCCRSIGTYAIACGFLYHPHWTALMVLWYHFQPDVNQDNDENSMQAEQVDLKWLKINWAQLISTFKAADCISQREEMITASLCINNLATSSDIAAKITVLLENFLLKRNRKIKADECWDSVGREIFRKKVESHIWKEEAVRFVMPSFSFKSCNTRTKVLGTLPDMAEKLGLARLEGFLHSLRAIYHHGGKLLIITDSRVYCDVMRVSDFTASEYSAALRKMVDPKTSDLEWTDLDEIFPNPDYSDDAKRQALLNIFGTSLDKVVDRIKSDADFCEVYNGVKKFVKGDFTFPREWTSRAVRQECGRVAKLSVQRTDAYQALISCLYPDHIRLSVHPSTCTTKFSVNLVGKTDWGTPWHNCALLQPDQSWTLIRKATAEKHGFVMCKCDGGMHYFFNNSGTIFTEKL